jgi:hypothetical protein
VLKKIQLKKENISDFFQEKWEHCDKIFLLNFIFHSLAKIRPKQTLHKRLWQSQKI